MKILVALPSLFFLAVIAVALLVKDVRQGMLNMLFWLMLCVVLPTFFFTILSLVGKGIGLMFPAIVRIMNYSALAVVVVWLGISFYGIFFGWKRISVENVTIASNKIPESFDGYRIVQLSDFHIGTYASSPECVERIVDKVNSLHPDLIVFTGDLVNSSSSEVEEFINVLQRLRAKDGVYSVLGNHDYCLYRKYYGEDTPAKELTKLLGHEEEIGWKMLRNSSVQLSRANDSIALIGVDNAGSRSFIDRSDLKKALTGIPQSEYKILLSHDPSHWRRKVLPETDIDLMLAGHTHAMQFKLFGWSPSEWAYPEWGGLYEDNGRKLFVSTGVGENIAFRFGAWPQVVLLTLKHLQ